MLIEIFSRKERNDYYWYLMKFWNIFAASEETFNDFSTFNTNFDNQNYEESMLKANKLYSKTKAAAEVRDQYELQLVNYIREKYWKELEFVTNYMSFTISKPAIFLLETIE